MKYNSITYEKVNRTAIITFNTPETMNAISANMMDEVQHALHDIEQDTSIGCAIVTGNGRAFMAGADLKLFRESSSEESTAYNNKIIQMNHSFENLRVPVIAAINGYAMGGGFELALSCTMRFASQRAKLALPEVKLGIIPGSGGTQRLPRIIPKGRAMRLLLTGETITAEEAYRLGVVDEVTESDELLPACLSLADKINANAPLAVEMAKKCVNVGLNMAFAEAMEYTDVQIKTLKHSSDAKEGPLSFVEKRAPVYKRA